MRKNKHYKCFVVMLLITCMMILQGCALKDAETSRKVTLSDDGVAIDVVLKADESQHYEWRYITRSNVLFESKSTMENDVFSNTYIKKYRFTLNDTRQDSLILVLIKDGDLENAKGYEYVITTDQDGNPVIGEPEERSIALFPELLQALQAAYNK